MAVAVRPCRWRAGGTPELSPSASIRSWTAPSATPLVHGIPAPPDTTTRPATSTHSTLAAPQHASSRHRALGPARRLSPGRGLPYRNLVERLLGARHCHSHPGGLQDHHRDRTNGIGGGIAIAHKTTLKVHTHTDDTLKTSEHLHFQIHTDPNTTLRGTLIYRPPGPQAPFSDSISDLASTHALISTDYILLGDLNFHLENNNDVNSTTLIANLANLGLRQLVTTPTHAVGHTLDPIFSTSAHITFNHTTELHWTDHHCIHFTFQKQVKHHRTLKPPRRHWSKVTQDQLTSALAQNPPNDPTDPDTAAHNLRQWINDYANSLTPLKKTSNNQATKKATWFTEELQTSKRICRKLKNKWLTEHTPDSLTAHKDATHRHHQLIRLAKRSSFKGRLDNNAHNSKELFSIVKELSNPSTNINDIPPSQELCDSLATFFHQKITDIHDSFNTTAAPTTPDTTPANTTQFDRPTSWANISDTDTRKFMNSIHSGSPSDPCPHHVYNKADIAIAPQLRKVINISGIQEKALEWTTSFLSVKTQRVRLPPYRSKATKIICGVP
ncbi:hypothetical protein NDU88_003567 [Pleurodeles waltl]|uniref:Endonuclease/exonuclease/phosphatase domain-containing protein n=1 Tax=Pleurodeles waltl TaxID=8319 RepID=A0AAV7NGR7_PLEWA|nr:hypothetical protein NDU88_003567 [Pleurodeles waltl]